MASSLGSQAVFASACSGHGFKHSAAIGEAIAQTVVSGKSAIDMSFFGFERLGMRVEDMIEIFNTSAAYSYASHHRFPNNILSGKWNANSTVFNLHKDVGMAVKLGNKLGAEVSLAEQTSEFLSKAIARGMKEQDFSFLYRDFEEIRKVKLT